MPPARFNLPPALRGDSFGPINIGPITSSGSLESLEFAEVTMTFRREKASNVPTQILSTSNGDITQTEDTITIKRFLPEASGNLVWDIEVKWPNGETLTLAANDAKWKVELDVSRPERAT